MTFDKSYSYDLTRTIISSVTKNAVFIAFVSKVKDEKTVCRKRIRYSFNPSLKNQLVAVGKMRTMDKVH